MTDDAVGDDQSRIARLRTGATERYTRLRDGHPSVRHTVEAYALTQRNNANQYAAAITYFSFLALFPLILLAVAVTGFVLSSNPDLQQSLLNHVTDSVPGDFGRTLKSSINTAIKARAGVGVIGLAGVLLTGLGWIGNLRQAIDAVWGRVAPKQNFVKSKLSNMLVLAGLGIALLVSLGLTAVGTSLTQQILSAVGLDDVPGSTFVLKILGVAIAVAGDMLIFWWLLIRLPQVELPDGLAWRGALLASVGFEILKIVGTYTIAHAASSPTAGPFASVIALLVWIQLVARWMLFSCAWTATLLAEHRLTELRNAEVQPTPQPVGRGHGRPRRPDDEDAPDVSPAAVGATLVGVGAVAGAVATVALTRARRDREG